jgi:hypothetical protein
MRNPDDLNPRQYALLRRLREHPTGFPLELWPKPATLRRWLRRPRFRAALADLASTFRTQRDLMLTGAASYAAMMVQQILLGPDREGLELHQLDSRQVKRLQSLTKLVRLDQIREKERRQSRRTRPRPSSAGDEGRLAQARAIAAPRPQAALPAPAGIAAD